MPKSRRIELKFADLVAQPAIELERIYRFLGVSYEPSMLDIERDTTYRRPSKRDERSWRDDAPPKEVPHHGSALRHGPYAGRLRASGLAPLANLGRAVDASSPRSSLESNTRVSASLRLLALRRVGGLSPPGALPEPCARRGAASAPRCAQSTSFTCAEPAGRSEATQAPVRRTAVRMRSTRPRDRRFPPQT